MAPPDFWVGLFLSLLQYLAAGSEEGWGASSKTGLARKPWFCRTGSCLAEPMLYRQLKLLQHFSPKSSLRSSSISLSDPKNVYSRRYFDSRAMNFGMWLSFDFAVRTHSSQISSASLCCS